MSRLEQRYRLVLWVLLPTAYRKTWAFHQDAPPVRRRPWLVALVVGIAVLLGLFPPVRPTNSWALVDWPGLSCVGLVGAAVAHPAAPALRRTPRTPSWSLALVLLALAVFGLRVVSPHIAGDFASTAFRTNSCCCRCDPTVSGGQPACSLDRMASSSEVPAAVRW